MSTQHIGSLDRIACRQTDTNPDWWLFDATPHQQTIAATLCMTCPALTACNRLRVHLGHDAAGTYAAVYQPLHDTETDAEFTAIVTAMGWGDIPTNPASFGDTGWTQLALWGPNVDARMLHTPPRRRRVGSGGGFSRGAGVADVAVPQGA